LPVDAPFARYEPADRPRGAIEPPADADVQLRNAPVDHGGFDLVVIPIDAHPGPSRVPPRSHVAAPVGLAVIAIAAFLGTRLLSTGRTPSLASSVGTRAEQETFDHSVSTFSSPIDLSRPGPTVPAGRVVRVSCRIYAPSIVSVSPDGFWYRISSPPWDDRDYAPANTFLNGDSANRFLRGAKPQPGPVHNTDFAVATCGGPDGSREVPRVATTSTFTGIRRDAPHGVPIRGMSTVVVSCRAYTPQLPSTVPSGYAYRIASPPWNNRSYAPARAFRNGDSAGSPTTRLVDAGVPICD
jgi:hypothetical protein